VRKKRDIARFVGLLLLFVGLAVVIDAALVQASAPNRVGLVVVHGDGSVIKQCIEFSESQITGYDVLERSGLDLNVDVSSGGIGAGICRIDNEGCTYPEEECFCQCSGGSTCIFWSYWHLIAGEWQFSQMGASGYSVSNGDVEGWLWGGGTAAGATQPPVILFDEICEPLSTDTPTPTHTPTHTPTSTNTPEPTDTPKPEPTPIIHHFNADRPTINVGESITLSWDLANAETAYLRYDGVEEGVVSPGSKTVSPTKTTVYTLIAHQGGSEAIAELTITVNAAPPTSTPTSQPAHQPADTAPPPTETPIPEPIISLNAASETLSTGACTLLSWDVQHGQTVYLDEVEVDRQDSQEACPEQTQTYTLRVVYPGGERTAQLTLEVVDAIAELVETPTVVAATPTTAELTTPATPPVAGATSISRSAAPTVDFRPVQRNASPQSLSPQQNVWSFWARLGIWGGLVGGWCLITTVALIGWAGIWWINKRKIKE
jgi:hypothetical protein